MAGLVAAGLACTTVERASRMPPAATRESPPPGIEDTARRVGEAAPDFSLPSSSGKVIALSQILADGPAVLVFYRGDW